MTKSDSIAKLAEALSAAQGEMVSAKKDSDNPFFKSKYSDLASVYDACRGPLAKHGLSVVQAPVFEESGRVGMHTLLMHSSGEWIQPPAMLMKPVKDDPQGFGSVITYLRRYCISALVGISSEIDDDGNAASNKTVERTTQPIAIPKVAAPAAVPKAIKGGGLEQAATVTEQLKASLEAMQRQPGDDSADECIDLPRQRALHREFRDAIKPEDARKGADHLLRDWLKHQGYVDAEGKGTTRTIPTLLFDEVLANAVTFAASVK